MSISNTIKEMVDAIEYDMWRLLVLERDITLYSVFPNRYAEQEKQDDIASYQSLSLTLFGKVRADRESI